MGRQVGLRLADRGWLGRAALLPAEALLGVAAPAWRAVCSARVQSGAGLLVVQQKQEGIHNCVSDLGQHPFPKAGHVAKASARDGEIDPSPSVEIAKSRGKAQMGEEMGLVVLSAVEGPSGQGSNEPITEFMGSVSRVRERTSSPVPV